MVRIGTVPSKNIVKTYTENGYYHIYNRGIEKREIFVDEQDCKVFLHYLKLYLSPVEELRKQAQIGIRINRFIPLNLSSEVELIAFALMPNHIHLLVKQNTKDGMVKFMRRLATSYVMYFNKKYDRIGSLFQNRYKAALIESEPYLLHLSRYIHLNPVKLNPQSVNFRNFSSYPYYLNQKEASWVKPSEILNFFQSSQMNKPKGMFSYQSFVEDYNQESTNLLGDLTLEAES